MDLKRKKLKTPKLGVIRNLGVFFVFILNVFVLLDKARFY